METRKKIQNRCQLICLVVLFLCTSLSATAAPVDETIVLTQKCQAIGGVHTVYLGKGILRIESPSLTIFAQAPKWVMTVMNPRKKVYFQTDYKTCLKFIKAARTPFSSIADSSSLKWRKAPGEKIAGLSSEEWCSDSPDDSHSKSSVKFWTDAEPRFAPQSAEIMADYYGLPSIGHGIPLRFFYKGTENSLVPMTPRHYDEDGRRQQDYRWLDTTAMKKMPATTALCAIPAGFKATKDYAQIAVATDIDNAGTRSILKDLIKHPDALFNSR